MTKVLEVRIEISDSEVGAAVNVVEMESALEIYSTDVRVGGMENVFPLSITYHLLVTKCIPTHKTRPSPNEYPHPLLVIFTDLQKPQCMTLASVSRLHSLD